MHDRGIDHYWVWIGNVLHVKNIQPAFKCSKSTMETAKKCVKCVQTIVTTPEPRNSEAFTISFVMLRNGLKEKNAQNYFKKLTILHTLLNHH